MIRLVAIVLLLIGFTSCTNQGPGEEKIPLSADDIYLDYRVTGDEEDPMVTILLQFRNRRATGGAMELEYPAKVLLDGKELPSNKSILTGYFYEWQAPASTFAGEHIIEFINKDGEKYTEKFTYQPMRLRTTLPNPIPREGFAITLGGLLPNDRVRILMTDTSFNSNGINRLMRVKNGRLLVTGEELEALARGPINLELVRETERPIEQNPGRGGKIAFYYRITRELNQD